MKENIFEYLLTTYNNLAYTHMYMHGFVDHGMVYMVITDSSVLPYVLKLDKASRGAGYSLRFRPSATQKAFLLSKGAKAICSEKFFNETVHNSTYNKGEIFEKMVTESYNQLWTKDSVPFTEDGDITVNNIPYQIKFEGATYTNEKILKKLQERG